MTNVFVRCDVWYQYSAKRQAVQRHVISPIGRFNWSESKNELSIHKLRFKFSFVHQTKSKDGWHRFQFGSIQNSNKWSFKKSNGILSFEAESRWTNWKVVESHTKCHRAMWIPNVCWFSADWSIYLWTQQNWNGICSQCKLMVVQSIDGTFSRNWRSKESKSFRTFYEFRTGVWTVSVLIVY